MDPAWNEDPSFCSISQGACSILMPCVNLDKCSSNSCKVNNQEYLQMHSDLRTDYLRNCCDQEISEHVIQSRDTERPMSTMCLNNSANDKPSNLPDVVWGEDPEKHLILDLSVEEHLGSSTLLSSLAVGDKNTGFEGGCKGQKVTACFFSWWSQVLCCGWCGI